MIQKVNEKVVEPESMLMIHFNGLCIVVLIACYVRLTHLMRVGTDIHRLGALIAVTVLAATPLLALEISQARAMRKVGLFRTWATDPWNQLDVICVLWVPATLLLGFARGADDATFDNFTAIGGLLLMIKLLGFLKVLNMKLATFVLALGIILYDIVSFLLVLLTVMLGFGFAFYTLISKKKLSLHDDDPDNVRCSRRAAFLDSRRFSRALALPLSLRARQPFGTVGETLLTMYNIGMLGDFDRDVFASDFAATLFVWYTFFVVIVNLNVLIAIVSDSYGARCVLCFAVCVALFERWRARR